MEEQKSVSLNIGSGNQLGVYLSLKDDMFKYRERRHSEWDDNYMLYRDKVRLNRFTQRQSVNIPLMKSAVRTLLKDICEAPDLYYCSLSNDDQKELFYNVHWHEVARKSKLPIKDIADKKQDLLYGRTFKSLSIRGGRVAINIGDPQDWLVHRYVDPTDINTARGVIHTNIFMPLSTVLRNDAYDKEGRDMLQKYVGTKDGAAMLVANMRRLMEKNNRLSTLGVLDMMSPLLGESWVSLDDAFIYKYDSKAGRDVVHYQVWANELVCLLDTPLRNILGNTRDDFWDENHPVSTWADDVDALDFWTDAVADTLRKPNFILNAWFSQMVENRTLKNFGMQFFNNAVLTDKPWNPESFEPSPFAWFPVPGEPEKIIKRVEIDDLETNLDEIKFLLDICERASAATSTQMGLPQEQQVTLGEVKMSYTNAKERVQAMKEFYWDSWEDFGTKYAKLLEGSGDKLDPMQVSRAGKDGKNRYAYTLDSGDYQDPYGYAVEVKQKESKLEEDVEKIKKLYALKSAMPSNQTLDMIFKEKLAEFADLAPEQIQMVMKEEKDIQMMMQAGGMGIQNGQVVPGQPGQMGAPQPGGGMGTPSMTNQSPLTTYLN